MTVFSDEESADLETFVGLRRRVLAAPRHSGLSSATHEHWPPLTSALGNSLAGALAAADPTAADSAIPGVALGVARGDTTLSAGASYTPGETLRLSVEGSAFPRYYAFYATAGHFDAVWSGWCGGLLAANEPAEWTAPMNASEVTLLAARTASAGEVVYQTLVLRRAGAAGPASGNRTALQSADDARPEPGTGVEAFVAATTPGLSIQALTRERSPPPGSMQMVDEGTPAVAHTSPRLEPTV
jgi:hypothetical protein